jgi:hypothetical protein
MAESGGPPLATFLVHSRVPEAEWHEIRRILLEVERDPALATIAQFAGGFLRPRD